MTANKTPNRYSSGFVCPACDAFASQEWHAIGYGETYDDGILHFSYLEALSDDDRYDLGATYPSSPARVVPGEWASSSCFACKEISIWRNAVVVHPARTSAGIPRHHPDMPPVVAELYDEARAVAPHSKRAGAALARSALEALLKFLDPDAPRGFRTLDGRIARLQKDVSSSSWKLLTVLRHAGNKSLHVEERPDAVTALILDPDDESKLPVLFEAINRLVDERITQERMANELLEALPEDVTRNAHRKSEAAAQGEIT
jgi:hypothetical protein